MLPHNPLHAPPAGVVRRLSDNGSLSPAGSIDASIHGMPDGISDADRKQRELYTRQQQLLREQRTADQEKLLATISGACMLPSQPSLLPPPAQTGQEKLLAHHLRWVEPASATFSTVLASAQTLTPGGCAGSPPQVSVFCLSNPARCAGCHTRRNRWPPSHLRQTCLGVDCQIWPAPRLFRSQAPVSGVCLSTCSGAHHRPLGPVVAAAVPPAEGVSDHLCRMLHTVLVGPRCDAPDAAGLHCIQTCTDACSCLRICAACHCKPSRPEHSEECPCTAAGLQLCAALLQITSASTRVVRWQL